MIGIFTILLIAIIILQVSVVILNHPFQTTFNNVIKLNSLHEMLRTLSFLPLSRRTSMQDEIKTLVNTVAVHNQFNGCSLCLKSKDGDTIIQIYRFTEPVGTNNPDKTQNPSFPHKFGLTQTEDTQMTNLESQLISRTKNMTEMQIIDRMPEVSDDSTSSVLFNEKKIAMAVVSPLILRTKEIGTLIWFSFRQFPIDNYTRNALQVANCTTALLIQKSSLFSQLSKDEQCQAVNKLW